MITNSRVVENKYLLHKSNKYLSNCSSFYPFLRQGLFLYLKNNNYKSVALPYFVPEGIYDPFLSNGFKIYFYDIDENGFIDKTFSQKVDIFVYIHYFGIYNSENIKTIIDNKSNYKLFIEDFAHTVYSNSLILSGDLCTFSFTKVIGVTEGSCIVFNRIPKQKTYYSKNTLVSFLIRLDLFIELYSNSYLNNNFFILAKLIGKIKSVLRFNYYNLLMKTYRYLQPEISTYSMQVIDRINYDEVNKIRLKYAELYFDNLDKELLFNIPKEYYCHQALFAFPIKTEKRGEFTELLRLNGISAFSFAYRWCFGDMQDKDMYQKHLLLPINHNLSENDIMTVVMKVNTLNKQRQIQK